MKTDRMVVYSVVVAHDTAFGIGKNGRMPWPRLSKDMHHFTRVTQGKESEQRNAVVMGRKTWDSLPQRPLPSRLNIVLSTTLPAAEEAIIVRSLDALDSMLKTAHLDNVFFIGGESIFKHAIHHYPIQNYYITEVFERYECNAFFPVTNSRDSKTLSASIHTSNGVTYRISHRVPLSEVDCNVEELKYLKLLERVLQHGEYISDRTGVGILSIFGNTKLHFDLRETFPLLTTKRVFWKTMARELLFFLSGKTNNKILQSQGVHIWDGNSSREFLDKIGHAEWEEGELGKFYGFQWRHWGADYPLDERSSSESQNVVHEGKEGHDQIAELIHGIKHNPSSRRHILTAWNPTDVHDVCLPPCHVLYQFHVHIFTKELSCTMYQRSADLFLGVPFNIASTALLTHLIAKTCDLTPRHMTVYYGNAHIYMNHIAAVKEQLSRAPLSMPKINITTKHDDLEGYTTDEIEVIEYKYHPAIKAEMAV